MATTSSTLIRPTEKQVGFLSTLLEERKGLPRAEEIRAGLNEEREAGRLTKVGASLAISALLEIKVPKPGRPTFDTEAGQAARATLESVPAGRYLADEVFLQVDKPEKGRWAGFVFVKEFEVIGDVEDEFSTIDFVQGVRVGILNPDAQTAKIDEAFREAVEKLVEDPQAAALAFGKRTFHCTICGRRLDVLESKERGIGPVCAKRLGLL